MHRVAITIFQFGKFNKKLEKIEETKADVSSSLRFRVFLLFYSDKERGTAKLTNYIKWFYS